MSYVSQEAAYEVALSAAAGDLRAGHEVRIGVVGNAYNRTSDGSSRSYSRGIVFEAGERGVKV
jgi:hypothetical protein